MPSHTNEASGLATSRLQQPEGGVPQVSRADCMCSKRTPTHTVCRDASCTVGYSPNNRESLTSLCVLAVGESPSDVTANK